MIYKIDSKQNQKIKDLVKLSQPKFSKEKKLFKIEGFHALEMAKESGVLVSVFATKEIENLDVRIEFVRSKHNQMVNIINMIDAPDNRKSAVLSSIKDFIKLCISDRKNQVVQLQKEFEEL